MSVEYEKILHLKKFKMNIQKVHSLKVPDIKFLQNLRILMIAYFLLITVNEPCIVDGRDQECFFKFLLVKTIVKEIAHKSLKIAKTC